MPKYQVEVHGECGLLEMDETVIFEADNDEAAERAGEATAADVFGNWASYGFEVFRVAYRLKEGDDE